ncbi:hypothetical protein [Modestobacter sp. I12A-02662]|uniref:FitA-like ribbon-helix-helix domain-containing protein n=1 Tax=Modestobacter sp. I12A-02662 TaxID=1730496 RepID=UPI0034DFF99D
MPVSITIRLPDEVHDVLTARAARAGQSLQQYLRTQLAALADRSDRDGFWQRVTDRVHDTGPRLPEDAVLQAGDSDRT